MLGTYGRALLPLSLLGHLAAVASAGCSSFGSRVECDCNPGTLQVRSLVPIAKLETSGAPCPYQPFCVSSLDGGACDQFDIPLSAAGTCHVVATATDGRQTTFDGTVTLQAVSSCCGPIYRGNDGPVTLFPSVDASAP